MISTFAAGQFRPGKCGCDAIHSRGHDSRAPEQMGELEVSGFSFVPPMNFV